MTSFNRGPITPRKTGSGGAADAADLTYTPSVLADWDGAADPGDGQEAFDQLAERTADLEAAPPAHVHDSDDVTYTPTTLTDWDSDADPGDVADALDQLAARVDDMEAIDHAAVTLGAGSDPALALSGQELTLADVLTPTEHTAIGNGAPHHASVTVGDHADHFLTLTGQQLDSVLVDQKKFLAGPTSGEAANPDWRALVGGDIPNEAITYARMQHVSATDKVLGRATAGAGDIEEIACTAAGRAILDDATAGDQRTTLGLGTAAVAASGDFAAAVHVHDSDDVTYVPTTLTDWDSDADPGDVEQALDQLAERVDDLEAAPPAHVHDASVVTYTPTTATDWDADTDPGDVDNALDQLAERVDDLEAGGGGGATQAIAQNSHGFAVGDLVKIASGVYAKAQADSEANAEVVGMVSAVADENNFTLLNIGFVSGLSSLTPDSVYFLSPTTAGGMTVTEPTVSGHISKPIFIAYSATAGYFFVWRGTVVGDTDVSTITFSGTDLLLGRASAGSGSGEEIACTAAGRALIDDADAAAQRVTLVAQGYVDRGDLAAWDWTVANFTTDATWRDLNLSAIVPANAKMVVLRVFLVDDAASSIFQVRRNGDTNVINASSLRTQVINITVNGDLYVQPDVNRIIEYYASNLTWTTLNVAVRGWFV